jgi:hypothetical protein
MHRSNIGSGLAWIAVVLLAGFMLAEKEKRRG